MSWPLTGNALSRFNNLMSDLRQYGDFPFVGSPDDITALWQTIKEASNGTLNPPLDDVANRSHYWTLRLVEYLGSQVTPCPPCPPATQTGLQWGPDETHLEEFKLNDAGLDDPLITSIAFPSLISVVTFVMEKSNGAASFSAPLLQTIDDFSGGGGGGSDGWTSWDTPELTTVTAGFLLYGNPLVSLNLSKLQSVAGSMDVIDGVPLSSADFPALESVGLLYYAAYFCPNLISLIHPVLNDVGGVDGTAALVIFANDVLPSIAFPSLVTIGSNMTSGNSIQVINNPLLTTVSFPVWLPTNGTDLTFTGNALSDTSVNHVLARAVANAGYVSGTIDLSGGTNSAPTGQGIIDKATLQGRGVTVNTN